jgi:hypothetical protein
MAHRLRMFPPGCGAATRRFALDPKCAGERGPLPFGVACSRSLSDGYQFVEGNAERGRRFDPDEDPAIPQRLSTSQTFDPPLAFQSASLLPSGEGMVQPRFVLLSCSTGLTLPVSSMFRRVHFPVASSPVVHRSVVVWDVLNAAAHKLLPSADQSALRFQSNRARK